MATASTSGAQITPRGEYHLQVYRKDKAQFTRGDQWSIQFAVSSSLVAAVKSGKRGDQIAHSGTRLLNRHMQVFCHEKAGKFYKDVISNIPGYECFLPGEKLPGHVIYATLPRAASAIIPDIVDHFAAGTFGMINSSQVSISRKAWSAQNTSIHIYLEVDDTAFQWLKDRLWMSAIGLHMIRWAHAPIKGITGYMAPDQDISEMRKQLQHQMTATQTPAPVALSIPALVATSSSGSVLAQDMPEPRDRHVTGEEAVMEVEEVKAGDTTSDSIDECLSPSHQILPFLEHLSPVEEQRLMDEVSQSILDRTILAQESKYTRKRTSTPEKRRKHRRNTTPSGNPISDPSESDSGTEREEV